MSSEPRAVFVLPITLLELITPKRLSIGLLVAHTLATCALDRCRYFSKSYVHWHTLLGI
jgi:hypothetical protein